MKHKLSHRQKINMRFVVSLLLTLLILLNIVLNIVNTNFKERKIHEENEEIVELTTFLIEDNNLEVALEFLEHYKDSHHIDFSIEDEDGNLIYTSIPREITEYSTTMRAKGENYIINIDNTHSITVDLLNQNIYYMNLVIILLSVGLVVVLLFSNRRSYDRISRDVEYIMHYIKSEEFKNEGFNYYEFEEIYDSLLEYTKQIDILNEQKILSVTGLAHDIKTPLTIIKSYINPYKNVTGSITRDKCLKAIDRISKLVDHLRQDDYAGAFYVFDFSKLIKKELQAYYSIFSHKKIDMKIELEDNAFIRWNMKQAAIVVDNLFSNAYYYSNPNSDYRIDLTIVGKEIVAVFKSKGNPISETEQKAIFQKGFRSNKTRILNEEGEGVGLYLIKILLMQVNATIDLHVEDETNIFTIKLPLSEQGPVDK